MLDLKESLPPGGTVLGGLEALVFALPKLVGLLIFFFSKDMRQLHLVTVDKIVATATASGPLKSEQVRFFWPALTAEMTIKSWMFFMPQGK